MKSKLISLLIALVAGAGTLSASIIEHVQIGDLYYNLDLDARTAEVTYLTSMSHEINYSSLTAVDIPSSVMYNLIPFNVTSIGWYAFSQSTNLQSVTIPGSIKNIDRYAFSKCTGLTSLTISEGVLNIGDFSFYGCTALTWVTIPNSVKRIGDGAFGDCSSLISVNIPDSVTSISSSTFKDCSSMNAISIPGHVTSIGNFAFAHCSSLTALYIRDGVKEIQHNAFEYCNNLPYVTLPGSITKMDRYAFGSCSKLKVVYCAGLTPATLDQNVFYNCPSDLAIFVPCEVADEYKSQWSAYSSLIRSTPARTQTASADSIRGSVSVPLTACDTLITATANYGYHFVQWSDGVTDNPRTINPMEEVIYIAEFDKNIYTITDLSDTVQGAIAGALKAEYLDRMKMTAVPKYGYRFVQWSDGVTDNPRYFILTCDTAFTAEFVPVIETDVSYLDKVGSVIKIEHIGLCAPQAPEFEGFTFIKWTAVSDNLTDGITIQAVYESNTPTSAPEVVNPANRTQKLIRNGNVYILTETKTYSVSGELAN